MEQLQPRPAHQLQIHSVHPDNHSWHKKDTSYSHADKIIMVFSTLIYLGVVLVLAILTDTLFNVIIGTFPTLVYLIINFMYLKEMERKHLLVWLLPIPLIIIFAAVGSAQISLVKNIDWQTLVVLNLFMSYILAAMIVFIGVPPKKKYVKKRQFKKHMEVPKQTTLTKEKIVEDLKSIEDKCKAINFVIGRVYSNKKGGSKDQREKIKFAREWYNTFSEITEEFPHERKRELAEIINKILERLRVLKKQEKDVFTIDDKPMLELKRNKDGSEIILEVLKNNDSDPIETYYNSVLEVAEIVLKFLKN